MYIILIMFFLYALFLVYTSKKHYKLVIGSRVYRIAYDECFFYILLAVLFFIWILKASSVGIDTYAYRNMYTLAGGYLNEGLVWKWNNQPLYYWLFATLEKTGLAFRTAQVIFYAFACTGICFFYKKYSNSKVLSLFFFVTCETMAIYSSALRQMLAITFGIFAIHFALKRNIWKTTAFLLFAILMHKSACILLLLLILYFYVPNQKQLIILTPCLWTLAALVPTGLLSKIALFFGYDEYIVYIGKPSNPLLIMMYVCMGVFVYWMIILKGNCETMQLRFFTTLFVFGIAIVIFSSKFYLITRLQYYFQIIQYLVFAEAVEKLLCKKKEVLFALIILLYVVFFAFTLRSDTLNVTPYKFFWEIGEKWT